MTLKQLHKRGLSHAAIGRTLGVTEGAVRYHLQRQATGATDGRAHQPHLADSWQDAVAAWLGSQVQDGPVNLAALHAWLVEEHGYPGSLRSVQRYFRAHFPKPAKRARRRVETPPGAQAQVDWAEFRGVRIAGEPVDLYAFHLQLSYSRFGAVVWSPRKEQLAWHHAHNEALRRIGGVPATLRVDNEKTAVSRGAVAWGEINLCYRRYAEAVRFHVDACPPRTPQAKGNIERRVEDQRFSASPYDRDWDGMEELQDRTDRRWLASSKRRTCPATGSSVYEAWQREKEFLAPLPILPEPFDLVASRQVRIDCLVSFEGRQYSVPFASVGRTVEVRGCPGRVQIVADCRVIAEHPRHTAERILLDPRHFEGKATATVLPPTPLGRMGRKLQAIAAMEPEKRPLDLYAELAEVAR